MGFLSLVVLLVVGVTLSSRIRHLEERLQHMERYLADTTQRFAQQSTQKAADGVTQEKIQEEVARIAKNVGGTSLHEVASKPGVVERFIDWCKVDWLMKLGGFLIILGVGWFVSYAFANDWIGPMGRIALGFVTGSLVLIVGRYRMVQFLTQGTVLMYLGAVTLALTTYAAREVYGFFTPFSALVLLFLMSLMLGVTSVVVRHRPLAYGNVVLAAIAPFLIVSTAPSLVGLFSYLLVVAVGSVTIAVYTGWRELVLASLVVTWFYSTPWFDGRSTELDAGLTFAYVFTALFFFVSILAMRKSEKVHMGDVCTAVGAGCFLLSWVLTAAPLEWQSMILIAWTVVFAVGARLAVLLRAGRPFFYAYAGVGAGLLGVATALELDGPLLTVAFTIEAAAVLLAGFSVLRSARSVWLLALPMLIPIVLSFDSLDAHAWNRGVFHEHAAVVLLLITVLVGLAAYFERVSRDFAGGEHHSVRSLAKTAWIIASLYTARLVWLVLHALTLRDEFGTMLSLFTYTAVAAGLFIYARYTGVGWQRTAAGVLIGFVVLRLLMIDIWSMATSGRVVTFVTIGVVLVAVAWIERNVWKNHVAGNESPHE